MLGLNLLNQNSLLEVNDILLSPTVGFLSGTVSHGNVVSIVGTAVPSYTISAELDGTLLPQTVTADAQGAYRMDYDTSDVAVGNHTVRTRQTSPRGTSSQFSPQRIFTVSNLFVPKTDFNNDGILNIQDWSVFLSRWVSTDPTQHALDDLNGDGVVDVSDFSIFAHTIKF